MQQRFLSVRQQSNSLPCTDLRQYLTSYNMQQFVQTCNKFPLFVSLCDWLLSSARQWQCYPAFTNLLRNLSGDFTGCPWALRNRHLVTQAVRVIRAVWERVPKACKNTLFLLFSQCTSKYFCLVSFSLLTYLFWCVWHCSLTFLLCCMHGAHTHTRQLQTSLAKKH